VNSEEIKARFGSYHVDVLEQDQTSRFANLYSIHDGVAVCRTLAITRFSQPISPALKDADKQIRAGHSIGNTLQQAGLLMSREVIIEARTPCGQQFSTLCAQTVLVDSPVYLRVYRLHAGAEPQKLTPYAIIAEAHHPEHTAVHAGLRSLSDLDASQWESDAKWSVDALQQALA
jgi:hypothetical protein